MTIGGEVSFGPWKFGHVPGTRFKKIGVEVRLTPTDFVVLVPGGQVLGSWPVDYIALGVVGETSGYLKIGREEIWITSTGRIQSQDLRNAIDERKNAGPSATVLVWSYPGKSMADAAALYAKHAPELATKGYSAVAQSWAEGRPGVGRVLTMGLMAFVDRPAGFLTVTYKLPEAATEQPQAFSTDPMEQIHRLGQLRDTGLITTEEFEAKKTELLARM